MIRGLARPSEDARRATPREAIDPYDVVPYDARPVALTHPARLAAAALRKGWVCAPPSACGMLELGCADATNLLPLALAYPQSRFVGVDSSAVQIGAARADAAALGIENLELIHADVRELGEDLGPFDYIVAHGVFSWVSDRARTRILRLYQSALSERGVGYLSYNTEPGWGLRGAVRDVLRSRTHAIRNPLDRIGHARAHVRTLLRVIGDTRGEPHSAQLAGILESLTSRSDSYLLHEYLNEHNRAFAFAEVVGALEARGLAVLDDLVRATTTYTAHEGLESELLRAGVPLAEVEAAIDLIMGRKLRASLICRESDRGSSSGATPRGQLWGCEIALAAGPSPTSSALDPVPSSGPRSARASGRPSLRRTGIGVTPGRAASLRAALAALAAVWPASLGIEVLCDRTHVAPDDRDSALRDLLRMCDLGYLDLRPHPLSVVSRAGPRPLVSALTRLDASRGRPVTNQLHGSVTLERGVSSVAGLLDGTRDLEAVATGLRAADPASEGLDAVELERQVTTGVRVLARNALLLG